MNNLFSTTSSVFMNRSVFGKSYIPKNILFREKEIKNLAYNLSAILNGSRPNDTILYGKRGTGKTLIAKYVTRELEKISPDIKIYHINLRGKDTNFKAWKEIARVVTKSDVLGRDADYIAHRVFNYLNSQDKKYIIFILDEINEIQAGYDGFLYYLLRPQEVSNLEKELSNIFITNAMNFPADLSEGTQSSFKTVDKYVYDPYNAQQLRGILKERAENGLLPTAYTEETLLLCAAYGAQQHGDARETIKLLSKAAEIAESEESVCINTSHVEKSLEAVEFDGITKVLNTLPLQLKTLALACVREFKKTTKSPEQKNANTSMTIFKEYESISKSMGIEHLSYRRINDYFNELETLGLINTQMVYSRGLTRVINPMVPIDVEKIITDDPRFEKYKPIIV